MFAWRSCLLVVRRRLHWECRRFSPSRDPACLDVFEPDIQGSPLSDSSGVVSEDDVTLRRHLRNAFCYKIREWARTTPHEYISKPPSRPRSKRTKQSLEHNKKDAVKKVNDVHDDDDECHDDHVENSDEAELDVESEIDDFGDSSQGDDVDASNEDHELNELNVEGDDITSDEEAEAQRMSLACDPQNDGHVDADEELYYYTSKGKLKYKPILILAPKQEIYERLSQSGLISSKLKRPMPVLKLVKKSDAEIVGWYYYCSIELLQFFRICHNLKEVKAIVEYHIRWSAIHTLAKKYNCNPREVVKKYGRDLECEDKKGKKIRLMTKQEIKEISRGVNKRVQMIHRFRALNILDEMD
ncbi:hypothetical protein KP509_31G003100 [Ceratopteris richardii]|uniref:Domain X domain-containing protein n=1 Tax=Ceratopteris richardii TaxID=49495 RepID=A0A8T2QV40_CERRI|nr:hypothetical protein KP509_31G003100 [Ceratopteris richardii]